MKSKFLIYPFVLLLCLVFSCKSSVQNNKQETEKKPEYNVLSEEESKEGWQLLFDGKTSNGWRNFNGDILSGWIVEDGCLVGLGKGGDIGGDIVSTGQYKYFILSWDWKLGPMGNSGVMYHVLEGEKYKAPYETGPEYQMIDDDNYEFVLEDWQKTASDYAMYVADSTKTLNVGEWNSSKIVYSSEKAEYWLNGEKVVEFVPGSDDWKQRRNSGKWDQYPDYGLAETGHLSLQDHGSKVWFRNIKIKAL
ncbi:DUF1080 domain-containing protein [Bacteroidota bacterium]